jgi:hypothetical protein
MTPKEFDILESYNQGEVDLINPFPGLRPFTFDESHLFFGREGQSDEVLAQSGPAQIYSGHWRFR